MLARHCWRWLNPGPHVRVQVRAQVAAFGITRLAHVRPPARHGVGGGRRLSARRALARDGRAPVRRRRRHAARPGARIPRRPRLVRPARGPPRPPRPLRHPLVPPDPGAAPHWRRLIEAGSAGLFLAFRPFAAPDLAEALMRAAWPLIWLFAGMGAVAALAWRIAGRNAALAALVVCACALPAFQHFKPGRIDHHNVQIALALPVVAAAAWSDRARQAAALAGALTGLAAAVGFEGLPFLVIGGG